MKRDFVKYIRMSDMENRRIENIAEQLGLSVSVILRHWINGVPIISVRRREYLNRLKIIIRNTRSNVTQISQLIEVVGGSRNDIIALSLYKRDLHDVYWTMRENCFIKGI